MIRAGRFLAAAAAFCALSLSAFEWELPGRAWTKVDPPGVWSFCSAPRGKSPAEWRTLEQKDVNTLENRLMFSEADGDAWGVPAVRVQKFQLPGEQILELLTGPSSDPAVVYECMAAGELAYEVAVSDPAPVPGPGADGNAMFRVSRIDAAGREAVLDEFTFRGSSGLIRSGALAVRPGDRIAFRKTATLADRLHKTREKAAAGFEKHILSTLARLGMPETVFRIALTPLAEPGRTGRDSVQFLFTANPRMTPQPVERIASGGELSRVMLALKALLAERMQLPTIIFDEIDTGVSGRIADAMGEIIASLSASMQVVDITHLPQVASKGTAHFVVYKRGGRTDITRLGDEERVTEIAKMLSGSEITDAAVAQARILLGK